MANKRDFDNPFKRTTITGDDLMSILSGKREAPRSVAITPQEAAIDNAVPENALLPDESGNLVYRGYTITKIGIIETGDPELDDYKALAELITGLHASFKWILADTVILGERAEWGKTYQAVIDSFGREYSTVANWCSVARRFNFSRRREKLSFSHHEALAGIADDALLEEWLNYCENTGISVSKLRAELRGERDGQPGTLPVDKALAAAYSRLSGTGILQRIESEPRAVLDMVEKARAYLDIIEKEARKAAAKREA